MARHRREQRPALGRLRERRSGGAATPALPSSIWGSTSRSTSATSSSTRATARPCTSRPRGRSGARAGTAVSTRPPTAAPTGSGCSTSPRTPGSVRWPWTPGIPTSSTRRPWQRRRHTGLLVAGGPEGGIHKSEDGGATWRKLSKGLPSADRHDIGRIGLAISPHNTDIVYALIAASDDASGFYRSTDRGESWEKRSDYICVDPQYYMEIFPDPHRPGRIYSMDVWTHVTDDDGATWRQVNSRWKHVDNHDLEFDPDDPDYLMMSSDGGIYESWDLGEALEVPRQPVPHPVLPGRDRQRLPLLQRLRRDAGQRHPGRPLADDQHPRHPEQRLARRHRWRRLPGAGGPRRSKHRLRAVPVRRDRPLRQADRGADGDPAAAGARRPAAQVELGRAAHHLAAQRAAALLRREPALPERRPGEHMGPDQRGSHPRDQPRRADRDGPHLEHRRGLAERLHLDLREHGGPRRVAAGGGAALHRDGRRPHPDHRRRRARMAGGGHRPRGAAAHLRGGPPRVPASREHRVRGLQQPQGGRLPALRDAERRPRGELGGHHRRPAGRPTHLDGGRGPGAGRAPLRRHRVRTVRHARRWRPVGAAEGRAADHRDPGPRDPDARRTT